LRFQVIANQTEHVVSGGEQLWNQRAPKNSGGARNGYSQSATPGFVSTLLILNVLGP
jgi:hypothetical protein